ncbi:DcaP family trimeric outer membrane transporter [Zoogloea dura]|uniref:Porin n=1 Tax=Zoogloea dura TaxID=2728840 RepID=A0A848GAA5_9RHOO|nr:DcaP family trimeric outer membrane transporter [Zoogloea dura]NML28290.1 hypothetical protein [Zoogloea dura]
MKAKQIFTALVIAGLGGTGSLAHAAGPDRMAELETQLKQLQEQLEALKRSTPSAQEVAALRDKVASQDKQAVVAGSIPNSFRLPGSETSLRIYGSAELNMVHESKGDNSANDYSTFTPFMPLNGSPEAQRKGQTYMHARTSRIGLEAATPTPLGPASMKIEGDFNNDPRTGNSAVYGDLRNIYTQLNTNSYDFRLRHAYVRIGGLLVGQSWSTFMDVNNAPETVDFNGPIGSTFIRQPQIRYTHSTQDWGDFSGAIENSVSYVLDSSGRATTDGFSKVPDLIARWDKRFDWGALSLRTVSHEHRIEGALGSQARRGNGFAASGQIKSIGDDFFTWGITGGTGIGRYFNMIQGAAYDSVQQRIEMEKAVGVVLGYQHKISDSLRLNAVYGAQRTSDNDYTDLAIRNGFGGGQYGVNRRISQFHFGGIWNPVKAMDVGLEYIFGRRETLLGEKGDMSRINMMVRYNLN